MKKSVLIKQKKEQEKIVKQVNRVIYDAVKNYDFLSTLIIDGEPEATYHNIKDFREAVEQMVKEVKEENKKREAK